MNNAISRLIESATDTAQEHAGKPWWEELSPEKQEQYLHEHPGSSKEEKQSTDVVPHGKNGNDAEPGKPAKKPSEDVVKYSEKPVSDKGEGKKGNESDKKTGNEVVPKGRRNDDITDVDFTEKPHSKESPKLNSPEKKSTDVTKKETPPAKSKNGPKWGAEDVDFKEVNDGGKENPKLSEKKSDKSESEPKKDDEKPGAVDRIKEDEEDERARRAEERREEKHQHQMEVLRTKEEERQADRAEQKRKEAEKNGEKPEDEKSKDKPASKPSSPAPSAPANKPSAPPASKPPVAPVKKPSGSPVAPTSPPNKPPVTPVKKPSGTPGAPPTPPGATPPGAPPSKNPPGAKPSAPGNKPPEKKKEEKKEEKKHDKKSHSTDRKHGGEKPGSPGSRSDPAAEQHKPNPTPNNEGAPNPHGGESGEGAGGAINRLKESGGESSPVPPSGKPSKPAGPLEPKGPPGAPDDTDVTFEDEPNPNAGPKPPQSKPENPKPHNGPSGSEPEKPGSELSPGFGGDAPSPKSEAPEVEEKPGSDSESIDVPESTGGESSPFEQQNEKSAPGEGSEIGTDDVSAPVTGPEDIEQGPGETSEPSPESNEVPVAETPEPVEQETPVEAPEPVGNETPETEAPAVEPSQDEVPESTPNIPEQQETPQSPESEKEDMGQSAPGFGGAPGAIPLSKGGDGGGSPKGGPESGGGGMPGQTSQPAMRDERGQPAKPYQMKAPGAEPTQKILHQQGQKPQQSQQQQPGGGVPTKPNSPARTQSADVIRNQAPNIAQRLMQDGEDVPKGMAAMYHIMQGRGTAQDGHAALSLLGTLLGTAATMAATGAGGPLGFATFMAIKHAGVPAMVAIVKKAFGGGMPTVNPEHQQEELTRLVQSAADYAQSGNIPAEAWHAGVQEAKQQQGG
jgi:hypothetical protein